MNAITQNTPTATLGVPFFVRGRLVEGEAVRIRSRDLGADLEMAELDLNALVTPRSAPPPLLDVPMAEIIAFLEETGKRLNFDTNDYLRETLEKIVETNPLPRRVVENLFRRASHFLTREVLESGLKVNFANPAVLDGWVEHVDMFGLKGAVRAFPPRMIHMLAGNSPSGCVSSIAQGAMVKAINVFKMPSSDPFSCVAVLRTMADIDATHPVVQSMSAVYWKGGDERIERTLYRPQYFDRIVGWGGGPAIQNLIKYLGPGLQLISFDPKTSISMIGRGAWSDPADIADVAERAAQDVSVFNQEACLASRFIYAEGEEAQLQAFCAALQLRLNIDRETASADAPPLPIDLREEVEMLQLMDDDVQVWGKGDGKGLVILSSEPVGFHPTNKTVNVVRVAALEDAVSRVNVATQTIGVWPPERKASLRDKIASAGGQRLCRLGSASRHVMGSPHDAMYPMQRFVHWMADEDA